MQNRFPRRLVLAGLGSGLVAGLFSALPAIALPRRTLVFPRDHGAHPDLRTEWWYITGQAVSGEGAKARQFGFQVTFFRSRVEATQNLKSKFAAKQLIFAHAAVTDVQGRKLWHDQRIAREGFEVTVAGVDDANLRLRDWSLKRQPASGAPATPGTPAETWLARVQAGDFALDLRLQPTQPMLLQGAQGLSRKGPDVSQASYYYSLPQLQTRGRISLKGETFDVTGNAWLDHEWSEALLHPDAVGWDWIGMNLLDSSALTAFRLRRADGSTLWSGGSFRSQSSTGLLTIIASPGEVEFSPQRWWTSPHTRARYPVEWVVRTPAGPYTVKAVIDNQELDSRVSTGAIYWEGLSELYDSNGKRVGLGYLEMTGYAKPLRM